MFESKSKTGVSRHVIEEYSDLFRLSYIYFLTSFVLGFFLSFNDWGVGDTIDVSAGVFNFILSFLSVLFVLLFHHIVFLYEARKHGAVIEVGVWPYGIGAAIVISFFSLGRIIFPMMFLEKISAGFQIGKRPMRLAPVEKSQIASMGLLSYAILLFISKLFINTYVGQKIFYISAFFIFFNCIPLYHNLNMYIFTGSKNAWAFVVGFVLSSVVFTYFFASVLASLGLSLLTAFVLWIIYHYYHELVIPGRK